VARETSNAKHKNVLLCISLLTTDNLKSSMMLTTIKLAMAHWLNWLTAKRATNNRVLCT